MRGVDVTYTYWNEIRFIPGSYKKNYAMILGNKSDC
jgi:hypothetical protein